MFSVFLDRTAEDTDSGGTKVVCTGVNPPPILAPPQKALEPTLGEVGKSFCVLSACNLLFPLELAVGEAAESAGDKGAGGGRTGAGETPRPERRDFLRIATSWRRATFSDVEDPSSDRMAEMRASREAMSASRVEMYSVEGTS